MSGTTVAVAHEELARILSLSVLDTFSTMFSIEPEVVKALQCEDLGPCEGLTAIVGLGGAVRGSIVFQCETPTARRLTRLMTGEEPAEDDQLIKDGIGEMGNIVAGGVKKHLDAAGTNVSISIPTVVQGHLHRVSATGNTSWTVLQLATEGEHLIAAARVVPA